MKLFSKKTKPQPSQLSRTEALACIPVISQQVSWEKNESDEVQIEYPLVLKPLLKAIFNRFNTHQHTPTKKLQLDSMGSTVWQAIDGEKTVKTIIQDFAATSGLTNQEAEMSVTTFLRELGKRGLILLK